VKEPSLQSSSFRRLTGIVVSLLVLALVLLMVSTLLRYPMDAPADERPTQTIPATPTPPVDSTPDTPTSEILALEAQGTAATATQDVNAEIALTVQPTPTRPESATEQPTPVSTSTATPPPLPEGLPLPTPDPKSPPLEAAEVHANTNWVNDVALADGALWAATSGGALRWDASTGEGAIFSLGDGPSSSQMTSVTMCPLPDFGLVFGSIGGIQVLDLETSEWKSIISGGATLRHDDVSTVDCDAQQGILAVGYADHGIDIYRERQGRWSYVEQGEGLAEQGVSTLAIGPGGVVWVASGGALSRLQGNRSDNFTAANSPLTGERIRSLSTDEVGTLWLTAGNRLYRLADGTWEVFDSEQVDDGFPAGTMVDLSAAQGGRVWLASDEAKICRFDPEFSTCIPAYGGADGMAAGPLTALVVGDGGSVAYGTGGSGSSMLTRGTWQEFAQPVGFPIGNRSFALETDSHGLVWLAGNGGVQQVSPQDPSIAYHFAPGRDGLSATNVRTLFADEVGGVWLGGIGASYFDGNGWKNFSAVDGLAGDEITAIAQDSQGRVWFGTRSGLSIWTGTTFFNLTTDNGLPDAEILSLAADGEGMWIGSASGGLYRFETNQLQVLTEENVALPSNTVTALLKRPDGVLFVGTDQGLARLGDGEVTLVGDVPATRITSLAANEEGVWAGTFGSGVYQSRDGESWQKLEVDDLELPEAVRALTVDSYGSVWIGSDSGGVVRVGAESKP
jgi:ligand-binding sensor domain-containing protein